MWHQQPDIDSVSRCCPQCLDICARAEEIGIGQPEIVLRRGSYHQVKPIQSGRFRRCGNHPYGYFTCWFIPFVVRQMLRRKCARQQDARLNKCFFSMTYGGSNDFCAVSRHASSPTHCVADAEAGNKRYFAVDGQQLSVIAPNPAEQTAEPRTVCHKHLTACLTKRLHILCPRILRAPNQSYKTRTVTPSRAFSVRRSLKWKPFRHHG